MEAKKWVQDIDDSMSDLKQKQKSLDEVLYEDDYNYMKDILSLRTENKKQKYNNRFLGGIYFATKDKQGYFNNAISDNNGKPIKLSPYNFNEYENILENNKDVNVYATINTFNDHMYNRKSDKVIAFNGLYIDIDTDHSNSSDNQKGLQDYFLDKGVNDMLLCNRDNLSINNQLLKPTYVVNSGHGIHLVYLFKHQIPANNEWIKKIWQGLQDYLIKHVQIALDNLVGGTIVTSNMIDSNCRDSSRLFRLPLTTNYKEDCKSVDCHVIESNRQARYDFFDLYHTLLPDFKDGAAKQRKNLRKQKNNPHNLHTINSKKSFNESYKKGYKGLRMLNLHRISDFNTLQTLRKGQNYDGSDYGFREVMLFHYAKYLGAIYSGKDFVKKLTEFNQDKFNIPLDRKQLDSIIKQYTKNINMKLNNQEYTIINGVKINNYGATNNSLIDLFHISSEEQHQLITIKSKQVRYENKKAKRQHDSLTKGAKFKRNQLIKKANEMFNNGKSKSNIAKELGKSVNTIKTYLKNFEGQA